MTTETTARPARRMFADGQAVNVEHAGSSWTATVHAGRYIKPGLSRSPRGHWQYSVTPGQGTTWVEGRSLTAV